MESNQKKFTSQKLQSILNSKSKSLHHNGSFDYNFLDKVAPVSSSLNSNQNENSVTFSSSKNNDEIQHNLDSILYQKGIVKIQEIQVESQMSNQQSTNEDTLKYRFNQNNPEYLDNAQTNSIVKKGVIRNSNNLNFKNNSAEKDLNQYLVEQLIPKFQQHKLLSKRYNQDDSWFKSDNSLPLYFKKTKLGQKAEPVYLKPPSQNHVQRRKLMIIEDQEQLNHSKIYNN